MKSTLLLLFGLVLTSIIPAAPVTNSLELSGSPAKPSHISFTENKGQVCDQDFKSRRDVLFSGSSDGIVYHLRNNGISYQLSRVDSWKEEIDQKTKEKRKAIERYSIYRVDINWLHANTRAVLKKKKSMKVIPIFICSTVLKERWK